MKNKESFTTYFEDIQNFVSKNTWFVEYDISKEDNEMSFTTRRHGYYGGEYSEHAGEEDIKEASRMCKLINLNYPYLQATWSTVDEWTNININPKDE